MAGCWGGRVGAGDESVSTFQGNLVVAGAGDMGRVEISGGGLAGAICMLTLEGLEWRCRVTDQK